MHIREERMAPHMLKLHIGDSGYVAHHFTAPDMGHPHDHPAAFMSYVVQGGYCEEVFALDGTSQVIERRPRDTFEVSAHHVHRIVNLFADECVTVIRFIEPKVHEPGFWEWRDGQPWRRDWNGAWQPVSIGEAA